MRSRTRSGAIVCRILGRPLVPVKRRLTPPLTRSNGGWRSTPGRRARGASMIVSRRASGSSMWDSSIRDARSPSACSSTRTVVRGGRSRSTNGMSLKPTSEKSAGQDSPSDAATSSAPRAMRSLAATIALGRIGPVNNPSATARPPSTVNDGASIVGPGSTPNERTAASNPAARRAPVDVVAGPAMCPMIRWPRAWRWSTASAMPAWSSGITADTPPRSIVRLTSTNGSPVVINSSMTSSRRRAVARSNPST